MKTFNIIKKNRKYFAATTNGYKCKILIDSNSENLEIGEYTLEVDDISVRTKYGTDLIFKLSSSVEEQKDVGICTLQHHAFNKILVEKCRNLGGKWDGDTWVFSGMVESEVEELDVVFNSELVTIEITNEDEVREWHDAVTFAGYSLAKARDRDSGAKLADGVALIEGKATSGGSAKNWVTKLVENSVLRLQVPCDLLTELDAEKTGVIDDFNYKIIG